MTAGEKKIGTTVVAALDSPIDVFPALVTPDLAQEWLTDQLPNRHVKRGNVQRWARDMRNGEWLDTVQCIQFNADGHLVDGQNRLHALILSGVEGQVMWIANGVPDEHRRVLDTGTTRSTADIMGILGVQLPSKSLGAAIARRVLLYERAPAKLWSGPDTALSNNELLDEIESHLDAYRAAIADGSQVKKAAAPKTWLKGSTHGALRILVHRHSRTPDLWPQFHHGVVTGEHLSSGDPRLTIRNVATEVIWGGGQSSMLAGVKVWNAYAQGKTLTKIVAGSPRYLPIPSIS